MTSSSSQKVSTEKGETWWDTLYDVVVNEELDLIAEESSDDKENALVLNDVRDSKEEGKQAKAMPLKGFLFLHPIHDFQGQWVSRQIMYR